jgi:transglutaminase-like putative cysteine protease
MRVERTLPFLVLATVALSGLLLGMGQGDFEPFVVAVLGATAALILVDWLKWFRLPNWMANLLAIIVTALTVSNFYFVNDSVRHLLGVGKLLVYLQTILIFQRKSARVYWQVLVLSLLQVVVGAVFNLGFEGGVLFIIYMMVAGLTMMVLHLYQDRQAIRSRHEEYRSLTAGRRLPSGRPLAISSNPGVRRGLLRRMVSSFLLFSLGALLFSVVLFYFLPRDHSSWSGPQEVAMRNTGFDERVDMDHSEVILLSSRLQMNVRYWYPGKSKTYPTSSPPYLRGMALSNIRIEGNRTRWEAPPYQIYSRDYRPLLAGRDDLWVLQEVVLEPTEDPLLYSVMPPQVASDEELLTDFEWCWPLGGLTRERTSETITVSHFRYTLKIPILDNGDFYAAWPYLPRDGDMPLTAEADPGNYKWLTWLDRSRYPAIVRTAGEIADRIRDGNHLTLARQMEAWFRSDRYSYTLDFRGMDRDPSIDRVEDFFANFRAGHCEYFASALALMLRSQGVPARMVVGYRGGDVNGFGGHLDVEARHAHAWVEAYIRPEDCSDFLRQTGQAGRYGAWLRLDPTPAVDPGGALAGGDDALDFAKSLWRDYVLGLQSETQSRVMVANRVRLSGLLRVLDLDWWQNSFRQLQDDLQEPGGWRRYVLPAGLLAVLAGALLWYLRQRSGTPLAGVAGQLPRQRTGLRRRIGRVLATVAPKLGEWVGGAGVEEPAVRFYARMLSTLDRAGYRKLPQQTGQEFAQQVAADTPANGPAAQIGTLTKTITDFYYRVRFGTQELNERQTVSVQSALDDLETLLAETSKV